jgi:hypothetical protein
MVLTGEGTGLRHVVEGEIDLADAEGCYYAARSKKKAGGLMPGLPECRQPLMESLDDYIVRLDAEMCRWRMQAGSPRSLL